MHPILAKLPPDARRLLSRVCRDGRDPDGGHLKLAVFALATELEWSPMQIRIAADFLVEAGLITTSGQTDPPQHSYPSRTISPTVAGESLVLHGVTPAEIRAELERSSNVAIHGDVSHSSIQIGVANQISTTNVEALEIEVRVRPGIMGTGPVVAIVTAEVLNRSARPLHVSSIRWLLADGQTLHLWKDLLGVVNGRRTIDAGAAASLTFKEHDLAGWLREHDVVGAVAIDQVGRMFASDSDAFAKLAARIRASESHVTGLGRV